MKILLVIDSFGSGGAQRQIVNLALGLHKSGHQVEFFIYFPQYQHFRSAIEQTGILIHECKKQHRFSLNVIRQLRRQLMKGNYDIALSFLDTPNFYLEIASVGLTKPIIVISERFVYPDGRLPWPMWFLQQFHRLADQITVNSHHQRERMIEEFPWMKQRIKTIYNGVDLTLFTPKTANITQSGSFQIRLLVVSSVLPRKNILNLIHALAIYRQHYGEPPLVHWAGAVQNSDESQSIYTEANQLLERLGLLSAWCWLGVRSDISALLHEYDALIHPSLYEGLPNAICEALAAGRPVLAANNGDNGRLLQNGQAGLLFDPKRPDDIAKQLHKFVQLTSESRQVMAAKARAIAERELAPSTYISNYEKLFLNLLSKSAVLRQHNQVWNSEKHVE